MNIGIITYKTHDERVLLNWNFNSLELFHIISNDKDFVHFEIFDKNNNRLLTTHYPHAVQQVVYVEVVKIEKETEVTGITYDAYRTPSTIRKTRVRWNVNGSRFRTKKRALEYVYWKNRRASLQIEWFVDRR
ncbi:hypothetical protein [Chryseobacterium profundimaris]|uniref:Uncharacterized protein n=1 Tax=Chryseobacterium profundimaris TaxID=1387275 RepID=A0ABY1NWL8_9FLAO|nr:hypothetical protein [Chryseobacterium profundimaris]SMP20285.1 hypothetical protein SAMN06264346_105229 [Chryseobacterium profundimaris]